METGFCSFFWWYMRFNLHIPALSFFEKSASDGTNRRIGGILTTDKKDFEDENILQNRLDFSYFTKNGWFNDHHGKLPEDVVGFPESVKFYKKGETLPNGQTMPNNGHWVEGYLLNTQKATALWELGKSLQGTPRKLGFSIEGKATERDPFNRGKVTAALVRNAAITHMPQNDDSKLDVLLKALQDIDDRCEKALTAGVALDHGALPDGPVTGEGAARLLSPRSLESKATAQMYSAKKAKRKKGLKKAMSPAEAVTMLRKQFPTIDARDLARFVLFTVRAKHDGKI